MSEAEVTEATEHLSLLKRFKKSLRLSLSAAEDLMVNGARAPDDRGTLVGLFEKVDDQVVQSALSREPLSSDRGLRAIFLGGLVRLKPSFENLLAFVETLGEADRRAAAEAFGLTVRRLPFDELSPPQFDQLLRLVAETFSEHDYTQAVLGLLDEAYPAIDRNLEALDPVTRLRISPLVAAHRVVIRNEPLPESEAGRAAVVEGVQQWLNAPASVLRSYPEKLRWRLTEFAVQSDDDVRPNTVPAALFATLPVNDPRFATLAVSRAEGLAKAGKIDAARSLLRPVVDRPGAPSGIKTLARVLSWPRIGKATFEPPTGSGRLRRAFELTVGAHGWGRTAPPQSAGALAAEARRQADLLVPGVAVVLGHGLGDSGDAYVVVAGRGRPWTLNPNAPLPEILQQILDAVLIARAVDGVGLTLPDLDPARFLIHGRPGRLTLADLSGVRASDPTQAALTHGPRLLGLARDVARNDQGQLRSDLPPAVAARLVGNTPVPLLVRTLVTALGRADMPRDSATDAVRSDGSKEHRPSGRRRHRGRNKGAGRKPTADRETEDTPVDRASSSAPAEPTEAPKPSRSPPESDPSGRAENPVDASPPASG